MSDRKSKSLTKQIGKFIKIEGYAVRSKAGAYLSTKYGNVWLKKADWTSAENNQKVIVSGVLMQGVDPMSNIPVAKQDESGVWSQGLAPANIYNDFHNDDKQSHSPASNAQKTKSAWIIKVSKVEILPKGVGT